MKYNKIHWVLVNVARAQTHRADQRVPGSRIRGTLSMGCGGQVIIRKSWP